MTEIFMVKHLGRLQPVDDAGQQVLAKIKHGETVRVEITKPRNPRHHRLFFALLNIVAQNSPHYDDPEDVLLALKIALGHVETVIGYEGRVYYVPKSISFAKMDQTEFDKFFDRCIDIVVKRFLPDVTNAELRHEIESMCGLSMAEPR